MSGLVKVRLLTRGANNNYRKHQVIEVDAKRAERLIDAGHAEEVKDSGETGLQELQNISIRL